LEERVSPRNFAERETKWDPNLTVKVGQADELFKPYDHQLAAWDKLEKYFHHDNKPAGILVVPTGGGKTAIAARWLLQHHIAKGGRVLWFAHRRSLLRQAFGTFVGAAYLAAPKKQIKLVAISAEDCGWSSVAKEHDVVFSSVQSAMQEGNFGFLDLMGQQSPGGLMVVIDEAHHAAAPGYRRVLTELQKRRAPLLGLTATPIRMDEADDKRLWNLFGGIVYEIDKKTLFNKGILATPHLETVATHVEFERDFTPADYAHLSRFGELGPRVLTRLAKHSGRNRLIVEYYVKNQEIYGQTIVFAVDTLHAQTLVDEFKKAGVDADYVDYTRKDSHAVMSAFRDKAKPKVLVNVEMLTEGFDAPKTRTVFLARPTKSEALLSQMIGRALRGPLAGGNAEAYLVTFLDTWSQFDVFDMEYVVSPFQAVAEETTPSRLPAKLVIISADLIREAYRLVQSNVRGSFEGIHQCLAYGWYIWEEEFDDDVQRRLVLVFENQRAGYEAFDAEYSDTSKIPAEVSEDLARDLVQRFFSNCPDPPPRWSDLQSILNGRRKDCQVVFYTFEEKKAFDPALLATRFFQEDLGPQKQDAQLRTLWDANDACKLVYRSDFKAFVEDVGRELTNLREDGTRDPIPPEIVRSVPKGHARRWPEGQPGVSLTVLKDAVLAQPRHFPDGPPVLKDLRFAAKPMTNVWGFFQFNDKAIVINPELNSPDIPRYVMEFLLYHELLHAHMPSAGHNRDFRDRERRFIPSPEAVAEAKRDGHVPGTSKDAWRVIADQFLDTFAEHFAGTHVGM
jgi:superfamily II DNA or RNA helicase